ncbi:MAG: protein kinase, partial [Gemmatimonadaceae bacterium]
MAKTCPTCGKTFDDKKAFCPDDMSTLVLSGDDTLVGTVIADRYLITDKIGEGGMGRVYRAQHVLLEKRQAAIKVLHPSLLHDSDSLTRFKREASNSSSINNPHVAQVYDFGEAGDGLVYLAIEFVPGETLTKVIGREGPLDSRRVAMLVGQIADGLDAAHKLGIVHRDLKPDNILVVKDSGGDECVKVVDFGIAKAIEGEGQRVTKTGFVTGTLEYMSPEQITGSDVDARSDVYALGLVTCEMLTKALPFPAARAEQSMMMRLTEDPRRLKDLNPNVVFPDEVQQTLDTALARDREQRYTSAGSFARALGLAVGGVESLPRTVVRGSDKPGAARSAAAATLPRTAIASSAASDAVGQPARGRLVPLVGGIAALLVVAVGGVLWALSRTTTAVTPASKDSAVAAQSSSPPAAASTSTPPPKDTVPSTVGPQATPGGSMSPSPLG